MPCVGTCVGGNESRRRTRAEFLRTAIGVGWVVPSRVVALVVALAAVVTVGGIAATPAWAGPQFHIDVYNKTKCEAVSTGSIPVVASRAAQRHYRVVRIAPVTAEPIGLATAVSVWPVGYDRGD
jgi:hypothetical protein